MEIVNLLENFETKPGTKCSGATYTIASMWIASKFRRGERSEQEQKIEIYSMNLLPDRLHFWQSPSFPVPFSTPAVPSSDGIKTGRRPSYRPFSNRRAMSGCKLLWMVAEALNAGWSVEVGGRDQPIKSEAAKGAAVLGCSFLPPLSRRNGDGHK